MHSYVLVGVRVQDEAHSSPLAKPFIWSMEWII